MYEPGLSGPALVELQRSLASVVMLDSSMYWAPRSRSELLATRRAESAHELQSRYDTWERSNPVWAQRRTGPDAARALGYDGPRGNEHASHRDLIYARRVAARAAALHGSGFDNATKTKMIEAYEPDRMVTSLARPVEGASLAWIDKPAVKSRSQLRAERRADNIATLDAAADRNVKPDSEARVQRRIDEAIVFLENAGPSQSRAELLARRRKERADAALSAYEAYQPFKPPKFSAPGAEPFWKVQKAHEVRLHQQLEAVDKEHESRVPPSEAAAQFDAMRTSAALPNTIPAAKTTAILPTGSVSAEIRNGERKWWVKPEHYPKVAPALPSNDEPFKLSMRDRRYLERKLSSGPKKEQRGYPIDERAIAEKVTALPPPSLHEAVNRKPFREYTGATFKFMPMEPREVMPGASDTNADGYEFTQPLYSSFTADRTFQEPNLPPRPQQTRAVANQPKAMRDRSRPATMASDRGPPLVRPAASAPTAPFGDMPLARDRPETTLGGRR